MFGKIEGAGIFKNDLIITFDSKQISKSKKVFTSDSCRIYIKDETNYYQIGFIQDLKITTNVKNVISDITITFPKKTTKDINKYKKDLTALGVTVK